MSSEVPQHQDRQQGSVTRSGRARLSSETIAILGVGAAIVGPLVALLIAGFSWFGEIDRKFEGIDDKFDDLREYNEERLEIVRQRQEDSLIQLRSTIDQRFENRDARMQELADRQTTLEAKQ